ncbi:jg12978 [Pararge aegeria aegeria]|uniref:Jg12978 protein n=1 Tax=Pararge aegeria aegeria TaxID=348720 RepID=A0A8S4RXI1_9NEOP|nr:jg12978 [Pararge aegeria aegeria]
MWTLAFDLTLHLILQGHQMKTEVLDQNTVCHMCRHLVTHYFLLSSDDLALWDAEPESFATDEAGESWKYSLRPCTEAVFMELFHEFRSVLAPELVRLLASLQESQVSPDDLPAILKKDAIYNAVGLAAFDLYDDVDFDEWFTKVLSQEIKVKDNNYRIIRRRVCQLIGQWCCVRASQSIRPAMYSCLLEPLTRSGEDPAVKLAAAEALRSTMDDFSFDVEQFEPFVPHALSALYDLLALGECAPNVRPWVLNVINESTKLSEPAHVYLLEDALELWLAIIETSPTGDPALIQLAHNLYPILEPSTEHLRVVVYIMQAYALLCPEEFFSGAGAKCMTVLDDMLSDLRTDGVITVLKMAEICISVNYPERNTFLGVKVIWPTLIRVIHCLLKGDDLPMVLSVRLCLLSRVILLSSDLFYKAVQEASVGLAEYDSDPAKVLSRLLHVWTEKMNLVTQVERWKVIGLGLAALLTTQNQTVLERFPAILLNLSEVLNDLMKMEDSGNYIEKIRMLHTKQIFGNVPVYARFAPKPEHPQEMLNLQ